MEYITYLLSLEHESYLNICSLILSYILNYFSKILIIWLPSNNIIFELLWLYWLLIDIGIPYSQLLYIIVIITMLLGLLTMMHVMNAPNIMKMTAILFVTILFITIFRATLSSYGPSLLWTTCWYLRVTSLSCFTNSSWSLLYHLELDQLEFEGGCYHICILRVVN